MNNQLAIVIPAYKTTFLKAALDSIASQTCSDFTLYIGDDCSPHNLENIVKQYRDKINLIYHRFDINLGSSNLVGQWERCIALTNGEPYIWLFSDDDIMEPRCVESFLSLPVNIRENYLVHFNIKVIDDKENVIKEPCRYPERMSAKEYLDAKLFQKGIISYVVEFIFPRWLYEQTGGFQKYDLAWGSDMMTWIKFADRCNGIFTTDGAKVMWRSSSENISPDKSHDIFIRKMIAQINYTSDIISFLKNRNYKVKFKYVRYIWGNLFRNIRYFDKKDLSILKCAYKNKIGFNFLSYMAYVTVKVKHLFGFIFI